jgi:hypothetical protein
MTKITRIRPSVIQCSSGISLLETFQTHPPFVLVVTAERLESLSANIARKFSLAHASSLNSMWPFNVVAQDADSSPHDFASA